MIRSSAQGFFDFSRDENDGDNVQNTVADQDIADGFHAWNFAQQNEETDHKGSDGKQKDEDRHQLMFSLQKTDGRVQFDGTVQNQNHSKHKRQQADDNVVLEIEDYANGQHTNGGEKLCRYTEAAGKIDEIHQKENRAHNHCNHANDLTNQAFHAKEQQDTQYNDGGGADKGFRFDFSE